NQTADCAAIAAGVAVLPFSFTAHAYDIYSTAPRQRNATLDWKLRHAARIFAVSRYARDLLRGRLSAADQGRVCTAYVGIPTALFRLEPQPADASGLRLLCVARFQEKKGLDTLIDACALLRDRGVRFHLRLIGDGPQRDELRTQVTRLALDGHVELPGPMPQEDVAQALRDCHVFVMPCRRDRTGDMDGIPTVFMEALASGRPVVSCAVSGVPSWSGTARPACWCRLMRRHRWRMRCSDSRPTRHCALSSAPPVGSWWNGSTTRIGMRGVSSSCSPAEPSPQSTRPGLPC